MKKKKMIVLLLVFSMIISSSIGTLMASEKNVQAASTYTGKIWKIKQVSLRKSKSKKAKSLRKIRKGTKVKVHYTSGSWRRDRKSVV